MRALTVCPGQADSARLEEVPSPLRESGTVLVRSLAIGICGTDEEILSGRYGRAAAGLMEEASSEFGFSPGDHARWFEAFEPRADDIKVVIDLGP